MEHMKIDPAVLAALGITEQALGKMTLGAFCDLVLSKGLSIWVRGFDKCAEDGHLIIVMAKPEALSS